MKKNKIITLILALAVCSSLILSLCSFTTIQDSSNYDVYTPLYTVDVEYVYHRQTATLDEYYYGQIPSFNRLLFGSDGSVSTNRASDYTIISNDSINYNNPAHIGSSYQVYLSTEDNSVAWFTGDFSLHGDIILDGDFQRFYDDSINISSLPSVLYDIVVEGFCYDLDGSYYPINISFVDESINPNGSVIYISDIMRFINYELDSQFDSLDNVFFINHIYCDMVSAEDIEVAYSSIYTIMHYDSVSDIQSNYTSYMRSFNQLLASVNYDNALEIGFNQGVSQAPGIWGGLGTFLTTSVGAFLDFEFFGGFTVANVLSLVVSVGIVLVFLRIFSGG